MHSLAVWSPFVHFFRLRQAEWKENPEANYYIGQWHPVGQFFGVTLALQEMMEKYGLTQAMGP